MAENETKVQNVLAAVQVAHDVIAHHSKTLFRRGMLQAMPSETSYEKTVR